MSGYGPDSVADGIVYPQFDHYVLNPPETVYPLDWVKAQNMALDKLGESSSDELRRMSGRVLRRWLDVAAGRLPKRYVLAEEDTKELPP